LSVLDPLDAAGWCTLAPLKSSAHASDHIAAFYQTDDFLVDRIASFVREGLAAGDQVIVVATLAY
jgi:DcmR-like sensory protein